MNPLRLYLAPTLLALGLCLASPDTAAQRIVINELSDIDFGSASSTGGRLRADMRFCVALDERRPYRVLAYGEEVGGAFELHSGPYRIPYRVRYTDRWRARGFRNLTPGQPLMDLRARGNFQGVCNRPNARIRVILPANALLQAPAGSYRSTLTLMVTPE
ncbi:MAG: hypothetical protein AAF465_08640 [Pseudomonadota bacterium]